MLIIAIGNIRERPPKPSTDKNIAYSVSNIKHRHRLIDAMIAAVLSDEHHPNKCIVLVPAVFVVHSLHCHQNQLLQTVEECHKSQQGKSNNTGWLLIILVTRLLIDVQ